MPSWPELMDFYLYFKGKHILTGHSAPRQSSRFKQSRQVHLVLYLRCQHVNAEPGLNSPGSVLQQELAWLLEGIKPCHA